MCGFFNCRGLKCNDVERLHGCGNLLSLRDYSNVWAPSGDLCEGGAAVNLICNPSFAAITECFPKAPLSNRSRAMTIEKGLVAPGHF